MQEVGSWGNEHCSLRERTRQNSTGEKHTQLGTCFLVAVLRVSVLGVIWDYSWWVYSEFPWCVHSEVSLVHIFRDSLVSVLKVSLMAVFRHLLGGFILVALGEGMEVFP